MFRTYNLFFIFLFYQVLMLTELSYHFVFSVRSFIFINIKFQLKNIQKEDVEVPFERQETIFQ